MLAVIAEDLRMAQWIALGDTMNRAGAKAGMTSMLIWSGDTDGAERGLVGQVSTGDPDPEGTARRWAELMQLQMVASDGDDGTVVFRGELEDGARSEGLPVKVWAVVDRDLWEAAQAPRSGRRRTVPDSAPAERTSQSGTEPGR